MATKTKAKSGKTKPRRKKITFYSRSPNQRLVFEYGDVLRNERGRITEKIESKSVVFDNSVYVWDPSDTDRPDWERSDELLEWLRDHPKKDTQREGAFWERGGAPDEPQPKLFDQLDAITRGAVDQDREAIEAVLDEERSTHNRDVVLEAGEAALVRLDEGDGSEAEPSPENSQT